MRNSKYKIILFLFILILIAFTGNAYCGEHAKDLFTSNYGKPDIDYGKIIFATIFVIVVAMFVLMLLKKVKFNNSGHNNIIDIVYNYPITSKEKLFIVKVTNEYLLLSSSSAGIQKLHTLDAANVESDISKSNIKKHEFANIFANSLRKSSDA